MHIFGKPTGRFVDRGTETQAGEKEPVTAGAARERPEAGSSRVTRESAAPNLRFVFAIVVALTALACLALGTGSAGAAVGHPVIRTFSTGPNSDPRSVATDTAGNIYVLEAGGGRIDKFGPTGSRLAFGATLGYVGETAITGTSAGPFDIAPWADQGLAVDRTGGADDGHIYFAHTDNNGTGDTLVFASTGAFLGRLGGTTSYHCAAAINQATGQFYESRANFQGIYRFPVPSGNLAALEPDGAITAAATGLETCALAVDSAGNVYAGSEPVRKYEASQLTAATPTPAAEINVPARALAIDPGNGDLYADSGSQIAVFNPAGVQQGTAFGSLSTSRGVAGAGNGNVIATDSNGGVFVYGPTAVNLPKATTGAASAITKTSADVAGTVDPDGAGAITGCEVRYGEDSGYSGGSVLCTPAAPINATSPVTAHLTGLVSGVAYHYRVFVTNANGTQMATEEQTFTTEGGAVEGVATSGATEVAKDAATLTGSFTGSGTEAHYFFEWGATSAFGHVTATPPGTNAGSPTGTFTATPAHITGLHASTTYHYRLVVTTPAGTSRSNEETFTTAPAVTNLTADPVTDVTDTAAELHGSFQGDSTYPTEYFYEWGPTVNYGNVTPALPGTVPAAAGKVDLPGAPITGLARGFTYHYRVIATNATGTVYSADATFKTAEAPQVGNLNSRNLQATSAELVGEVNPRYGSTTWYFEWGPTATYGNKSPLPVGDAGSENTALPVAAQITGLTQGVTYHFRLVATNQYGTSVTPDQTFGFYPPNCPNAQLRAETRSNTLPDCRAYELVTPGFAQGAVIFPLNGPTSPVATSPSKIAYAGAFGAFPPEAGDPQNLLADLYVSTRTDTGWYQKFIGKSVTETPLMGGPPRSQQENYLEGQHVGPSTLQKGVQSDPTMSRIADYDQGSPFFFQERPKLVSNAPYIWNTSTGGLLGRWPTNLAQVPNGERFAGFPEASADFSHFVFQSNLVFAPGGNYVEREIECCEFLPEYEPWKQAPPASIYDNDTKTGGVRLASVKSDGTGFEGFVYNISEDGSHIVMAEERSTPVGIFLQPNVNSLKNIKGPFYIRVNGERTYEVGKGHELTYYGSSGDGATAYFRSAEQLSPEDHDRSTDLYAWHESEPNKLQLISIGNYGQAGNTDECNHITWNGGGCNIEILDFIKYSEPISGQGGNGHSDSPIASQAGDVYFISPEALLAGKGEPGAANLYLFRKGTLRFVAALEPTPTCTTVDLINGTWCATGPVARMQVTPDGSHMAFVTTSRIGTYNNAGHTEMYTYQPESGKVTCASCRLDGQPPTGEVLASQNGLFQAYDGRVFFSSSDALVPRDTNGSEDEYEYTEGRPQLISSGIGISFNGNKFSGLTGTQTAPGFVSVSANGTDAYFASTETLVTQDHNGAAIKIYDARTGGGFPAETTPEKCEAADECHGPGIEAPALPPDRTSSYVGNGNVKKAKAKHKKHHKKKHAKKAGKKKAPRKTKAKGKGGKHRGQ
jgi:hypothetical protein